MTDEKVEVPLRPETLLTTPPATNDAADSPKCCQPSAVSRM